MRAINVRATATKTMLNQLVINGHIELKLWVGYQVGAVSVVVITAGCFGGYVELYVASIHALFSLVLMALARLQKIAEYATSPLNGTIACYF